MCFFSVVIPCYNASSTLRETLRSVQSQTFEDFEVIILDDGSTDDSASIAASFASEDKRFRLVKLENGGPSRARNIGAMYFSSGEYVAFLDSDDIWAEQKLQHSADALALKDAPDALYARIAFFRGTPEAARTVSTVLPQPVTVQDLLNENAVCTMSNIVVSTHRFRSSGGFDPTIVHAEDVEWLVRLVAGGARLTALDETLVYYRASDEGLSANLDAMQKGWRSAVESAQEYGVNLDHSALSNAETVHLRYLARRALRVRVPRGTALQFAMSGIFKSPSAFFNQPLRGALTLAGAIVEPFMPDVLRRRVFAH